MKIKYNNKEIEIQENMKISEILKEEIESRKIPVISAKFNNEYCSLDKEIEEDGTIELLDISTKEGMKIYRRTLVYIMGKACWELYPDAIVDVDYQLPNAMFCDMPNMETTDEVINQIKTRMREIIDNDLKIEKRNMTRSEAKEFYKRYPSSKGRLQLDLQENEQISLYHCENYFNYFYGDLAIRTGVTQNFDILKYAEGFLIIYPTSNEPMKMPKYKDNIKLRWALKEYEVIHKILNIITVDRLNEVIEKGQIKEVIMLAEALHEKKIANIADDIKKRPNVKMILIAGPSSSGKTTFAQRLGIQLKLNGIKPVTISVDNYFVEREKNPKDENGNYDFECIEAIDINLFNDHLIKLLNGEEVEMPEFNFKKGTKEYKGKKLHLAEDEVLVIEGIHCLNDKLTEKIAKEQKYKIYISALTVLNMDHFNRVSTTDTRLVRRIVRDYKFRGYSAQDTIKAWDKVNEGEEKNIFPFQEEADVIFNTSLIYELSALKDIAIPLLEDISRDEEQYAEARRIINILKFFKSIPPEYIPTNSLLKEFLGGGDFKY